MSILTWNSYKKNLTMQNTTVVGVWAAHPSAVASMYAGDDDA